MKDTLSVTGSAVSSGARILALLYELGFPHDSIVVPVSIHDARIESELNTLFPYDYESSFLQKVRHWIRERNW